MIKIRITKIVSSPTKRMTRSIVELLILVGIIDGYDEISGVSANWRSTREEKFNVPFELVLDRSRRGAFRNPRIVNEYL